MRHVVTFPEHGPIIVAYGCSECHWIYRPIIDGLPVTSELGQAVGCWEAQVAFEAHDLRDPSQPVQSRGYANFDPSRAEPDHPG